MSTTHTTAGASPVAPQKSISISVSNDRMRIVVGIHVKQADLRASAERIATSVQRLKPAQAITSDEVYVWLTENLNASGLIKGKALLSGTAPVYPVDERIEWSDEFFSKGFQTDPETGVINYRQRSGRSSVAKDELIATIHLGTPGQDGRNVFGDKIPVAKPKVIKLGVGKNVRKNESDRTYFAETDGRVQLIGGKLAVSDVYTIAGDVGLASGNIDHPGAIIVEGDIQEDATVRASGDIEIHGIVEAATISTDGSLFVHGGICGKPGTTIRVGGEIHAMYILDCDIEAGGDIIVAREITYSEIRTLGRVRVPDGRIVGGKMVALGGIEVGEAGSDGCIPTILMAGVDYQGATQRSGYTEEIAAATMQLGKIQTALSHLLPVLSKLPPHRRELVEKLQANGAKLTAQIEELEGEAAASTGKSEERADHTILVRKQLFADVKVNIRRTWNRFRHAVPGPVRIEYVGEEIRARSER